MLIYRVLILKSSWSEWTGVDLIPSLIQQKLLPWRLVLAMEKAIPFMATHSACLVEVVTHRSTVPKAYEDAVSKTPANPDMVSKEGAGRIAVSGSSVFVHHWYPPALLICDLNRFLCCWSLLLRTHSVLKPSALTQWLSDLRRWWAEAPKN